MNPKQAALKPTLTKCLAGTLIGKRCIITFPASTTAVEFCPNGEMKWVSTDARTNAVTAGAENFSYLQLDQDLLMVNWVEKTGNMISQIINITTKEVHAFWTDSALRACTNGYTGLIKGRIEVL